MATEFYVGCRTCKVYRDLDKFWRMQISVNNREDALKYAEEMQEDSFRAGLLVSFMGEHMGHDCVAFDEHQTRIMKEFNKDLTGENKESDIFWDETQSYE